MTTSRATTPELASNPLPSERRPAVEVVAAAVRRTIAALLVVLGSAAAAPAARADGIPRFPFEIYAGAGVTEWAHAELDLVFGSIGYLLARAAVAGRGDPLLGGGLVLTAPLGSAWGESTPPAHALLLGLVGMYNPESPGFVNPRRVVMSPIRREPLYGYGEATLGYGFHARSGLGIRIVGGGLFDKGGFLLPMVRFSIGAGQSLDW